MEIVVLLGLVVELHKKKKKKTFLIDRIDFHYILYLLDLIFNIFSSCFTFLKWRTKVLQSLVLWHHNHIVMWISSYLLVSFRYLFVFKHKLKKYFTITFSYPIPIRKFITRLYKTMDIRFCYIGHEMLYMFYDSVFFFQLSTVCSRDWLLSVNVSSFPVFHRNLVSRSLERDGKSKESWILEQLNQCYFIEMVFTLKGTILLIHSC